MATTNHLFRREATYYWRCRLPRPIGTILRRSHLARSLRTKEPDRARRLARHLSTVVEELAGRLRGAEMTGRRLPTEADLGRILDDIFSDILEAGEQNRAARPFGFSPWTITEPTEAENASVEGQIDPHTGEPLDPTTLAEDCADPDIGGNWRVHLRHNKLDEVAPIVERYLDERNLAMPPNSPEWRVFLRKAMATHGAALDIESEREQGTYRPVVHPFAVMGGGGGGLSILGMEGARQKVSEIFDQHIKVKNQEGKWKPGSDSEAAVRMACRLFIACKGDLPFAQVIAPDAWDFRAWLCNLPSLLGKSIYAGQDYTEQANLRQAVEDALKAAGDKADIIKVQGRKMTRAEAESRTQKLSKTTVNKHLIYLHDAFSDRIRRSGYPLPNPFSGVLFSDAEVDAEKNDRIVWSADELNALFALPVWSGETRSDNSTSGGNIADDGHFWAPLIALFAGARRAEIAALAVEDLYQDPDAGCWVFHFSRGKGTAKTRAGDDRKVPLHPILERIGLLEYRQAVAATNSPHLFPVFHGLKKEPGEVLGKWFTECCQDGGIYRQWRDFHALRHTFKTQLISQLKAHKLMVDQLMGHKHADDMDVVYFHGFEPKDTADTLRALDYKGLDLSPLFRENQPNRCYIADRSRPATTAKKAPPVPKPPATSTARPSASKAGKSKDNRSTRKRELVPGKLRAAKIKTPQTPAD